MTNKLQVIHMSFAKVYKYKSICFDWHEYLGPTFLRMKDYEAKSEQYRPFREYGLLNQWMKLNDEGREEYRV